MEDWFIHLASPTNTCSPSPSNISTPTDLSQENPNYSFLLPFAQYNLQCPGYYLPVLQGKWVYPHSNSTCRIWNKIISYSAITRDPHRGGWVGGWVVGRAGGMMFAKVKEQLRWNNYNACKSPKYPISAACCNDLQQIRNSLPIPVLNRQLVHWTTSSKTRLPRALTLQLSFTSSDCVLQNTALQPSNSRL